MPEKKIDRRTLKTRNAIYEGLAELLAEKSLKNITVQELSDKIDIHRVTFYKHFRDIYDVYEQLEQGILNGLERLIDEYGEKPPFAFYPEIFGYIEKNPKIFKMIFSPHNTGLIYRKLLELVKKLNSQIWRERFGIDTDDPTAEQVILFHSNGCLALIAKWVLSDYAEPKEFIVKTISALDDNTVKFMQNRKK